MLVQARSIIETFRHSRALPEETSMQYYIMLSSMSKAPQHSAAVLRPAKQRRFRFPESRSEGGISRSLDSANMRDSKGRNKKREISRKALNNPHSPALNQLIELLNHPIKHIHLILKHSRPILHVPLRVQLFGLNLRRFAFNNANT